MLENWINMRRSGSNNNTASRFDWYSNLVSGSPKKVIVVIILLTLIMGYFASGMEMDTEEEQFEPESAKQDYLATVKKSFGREEIEKDTVQIIFTGEDNDVFTVDVMMDMLKVEEALQEDEKVNRTILRTFDMPTGINTLTTNFMTADRMLKIESSVIHMGMMSSEIRSTAENQTTIYEYMNTSLAKNVLLLEEFEEISSWDGLIGANMTLTSMSRIAPEPAYWHDIEEYREDFFNLTGTLLAYEDIDHQEASVFIDNWLAEMEGTEVKETPFYELIQGTNYILDAGDVPPESKATTRNMTGFFLRIAEPISNLQPPENGKPSGEEFSIEMTHEEKVERLNELTDDEIKETVADIVNYDPSELNEAIAIGETNYAEGIEKVEEGLTHLFIMEEMLGMAIEEIGEYIDTDDLEDYQRFVRQSIDTTSNETIVEFSTSKATIQQSERFGPALEAMDGAINRTVSVDYSPTEHPESIVAESSMAVMFMDPDIEDDERLEGQKRAMSISEEVAENSEIRVFGMLLMIEEINETANRSLNQLLPIAFVLVVIILLIIFRSFVKTVLSLGTLGIAILWTFGFGVLFGYNFNPMIVAVPILITGLVIDYGIHMVMRYREEKDKENTPRDSSRITIMTVGAALFLTSFTTAVGFISNRMSNIGAMKQFGTLAAVGIISSFVLMTTFLPAVIQLLDERKDEPQKKKLKNKLTEAAEERGADIVSRVLSKSADASDKHPWVVLLVVVMISGLSIYGAFNLDTTFSLEDFLPEDQPQSQNIVFMSRHFRASESHAFILTDTPGVDSSDYLYAVRDTTEHIADLELVGRDDGDVHSPLSVLQTYGMAPRGSPEHNETIVNIFLASDTNDDGIPNQNVTLLYDLLFQFDESSNAVMSVLNRTAGPNGEYRYNMALIRLLEDAETILADMNKAEVLEEELVGAVEPLKEAGFAAKITSSSMIGQETSSELNATQIQSLIATMIIVAITLTLVFYFNDQSLVLGVITTAPVAMITLWILGTMFIFDIPLNVMTVTITALTVGMGVDYSIHISHRFLEERSKFENNLYRAMHNTVQNTGAGIFGSATTTIAAFAVIWTSDIPPLSQFGGITALAMLYSFIAAVFILPAALMVWAKHHEPK
ncbi:MAG: efflux RND transporter permease subunit [Thermoplasmata archaeon]